MTPIAVGRMQVSTTADSQIVFRAMVVLLLRIIPPGNARAVTVPAVGQGQYSIIPATLIVHPAMLAMHLPIIIHINVHYAIAHPPGAGQVSTTVVAILIAFPVTRKIDPEIMNQANAQTAITPSVGVMEEVGMGVMQLVS
jgi:hypothetical protein